MIKYIRVPVTPTNERILEKFPSAGPRANVAGMRAMYWGKNALVVACGLYVYHVDPATFARLRF